MSQRQRFILIGHPVGHSVSPQIHEAAYRAHSVDATYHTVDCPDAAAVEAQVNALRRGELSGANVTVPYKRLALELADDIEKSAAAIGAANVLTRLPDGRIRAHNTDAPALAGRIAGAAAARPFDCLVLGSGGAALAAVVACRLAGATVVRVSARKWTSADSTGWPRSSEFQRLGAVPTRWTEGPAPAEESPGPCTWSVAPRCAVVVQASSAGMLGVANGDAVCRVLPWDALAPGTFCYDAVYNPPLTPFLLAAQERGLRFEGGLSMLVGQAALAIELWLGFAPDQAALMAAARQAIFGSEDL